MRKKLRVFSSLAVVVLSVCMFAFGVYAANQVSITTTGTVSFTATGVFAEVTGQISGVSETVTYDKLTFNSNGVNGDVTSWAENDVTFTSDNELTLTITVKNLATEEGRNVYVALYDIDQPEELKTTMKVGEKSYLASTVTEIAPEGQVTFEIKLTPKNLNESFTANYEYLLDLDSEKLNAERIESKIKTGVNNKDYGTMTYSLDSTKTKLTLTATPKSGYKFLGFTQGNYADGSFIYDGEYDVSTYVVNLNACVTRQFNAIFYSSKNELKFGYDENNNIIDNNNWELYYIYQDANFARLAAGAMETIANIPEFITYQNKEYKVFGFYSSPELRFTQSFTELKLPEFITVADFQCIEGAQDKTNYDLLLTNVNCFSSVPESALFGRMFINNVMAMCNANSNNLYVPPAATCVNVYLHSDIIEFVQYNEWFSQHYKKAETSTPYNGATYYLYTYDATVA